MKQVSEEGKARILLQKNGSTFCIERGSFGSIDYRIKRCKKHFVPMLDDGWALVIRRTQVMHSYYDDEPVEDKGGKI